MSKKIKVTASTIQRLLDEKFYNNDQHLIAFEVADGTGSAASRRADAVSFELWPSKGYVITGYEVKVSRSDWLSEMKQPDKSRAISQYCDHWYLVAPEGVLGIDELPEGWGWIKATEKSLRTKIKAPKRNTVNLDRCFVASLMRKCVTKYGDDSLLQEKIGEFKKNFSHDIVEDAKRKIDTLEKRVAHFQSIVSEFRKATGVDMNRWNYSKTVDAVAALNNKVTREDLVTALKSKVEGQKVVMSNDLKSIKALEGWPDE